MAVPPVKQPRSISQARKMNKDYFVGKEGKKKAAVTKEELKESGFKSLREFLNNRRKEAKTGADISAPKSPIKKDISLPKRPKPISKIIDSGASSPESKSKNDSTRNIADDENRKYKDILGTREQSRAARRARQEAKTKADTSMTPEQKLSGQIGIGAAAAALIAPVALPILMKVATKHGPAFARSLGNKIKNLTSGQQKNVVQEANRAPTKTTAQKRTSEILQSSGRTQSARKPLKRDDVSAASKATKNTQSTPRTAAQKRSDAMSDAAKQSQRREIDPSYTGGALKKGGQIKKYNKGGKVYKRKEGGNLKSVEAQKNPGLSKLPTNVRNRMGYAKSGGKVYKRKKGGQVISGNDLVSSIYN